MNNFQVLAMTDNDKVERAQKVAVIAFNEDLKRGVQNFYAMKENIIYSPYEDFKPTNTSGQRLNAMCQENFFNLQIEARNTFNKLIETFSQNNGQAAEAIEILRNENNEKQKRISKLAAEIAEIKSRGVSMTNSDQLEAMINKATKQITEAAAAFKPSQNNDYKTLIVKSDKKTVVIEQAVHENFERVLERINDNEPVYLYGPAGTGKSVLAEQAAEALGLEFCPVSTVTQEFKLTGFIDAMGNYKPTQFYKAFKYGGLFFMDEMDASTKEVLITLNGAIANKYFDFPHEFVNAHPDFRVIAAGNTAGTGADNVYTGRSQIDGSTMDRYYGIECDYSPRIERAITQNNTELLDFVHALRQASKETDIHLLVSYRSMGRIHKEELRKGAACDLVQLLSEALIKGMLPKDDLKQLTRNMYIDGPNKYFSALKKLAA